MPYLVQIDGYDPVAGAAVSVRASSVDDDRVCHLDGANGVWWPSIATLPELRYDILDGGFSGKITTPESSIALAIEPWPNFPRYNLSDARVRIWEGNAGDAWGAWTQRYDGRSKAQPNIAAGRASLTFAVDDAWLDKPLLALYAGTGGAEGDAALKGVPKPLALGAPRFVPGLLIDTNNLIFQLSAYGGIQDVEVAFERILRFGASAGDYATHAALAAAAIPAGRWATCKAEGKVRHGAPPVQGGRFCYHVQGDQAGPDGWVRLPGQIIKRLCLIGGGAGRFSEAAVDALDAARPWNVSFYANQQLTIREAIYRIAASVNAVAGVDWLGQLVVWPLPALGGAAAVTLDATGGALPPVAKIEQIPVDPPYWRMAIETEKTWDVHQLDEIAFTAVLVDRGNYSAAETYREGNLVTNQNVQWLYINAAPSAGNAPPAMPTTANAWWKMVDPRLGSLGGLSDLNVVKLGPTGQVVETNGFTPVTDASALNNYVTIGANGALSGAGGGQVTIGGLGYTGALNATFDGIVDTRNTDSAPTYYRANYAFKVAREFKDSSAIGVPNSIATAYGILETWVDWTDATGGKIKQRFTYGGGGAGNSLAGYVYERAEATTTTWSAWQANFNGFNRPRTGGDLLTAGGNTLTDTGTFGLLNSGITIGANGAISGAGGGQVTLPGLGAGSLAYGNDIGSGNLLRNSSFDTSTQIAGMADGFNAYDSQGNATFSQVAGRLGGLAQRLSWNANTGVKGLYLASYGMSNENIFKPGKTYVWSWWAKASGAAIGQQFALAWNVAPASVTAVQNPALTANYQRYIFKIVWGAAADPNGFNYIAGANGVSTLDFDDMQVEEGDTATGYGPRATEFLPGVITYDILSASAGRLGVNLRDSTGANSLTETGTWGVRNSGVSIGSNGALSGGGGGQVTITGLGYLGDLNAGTAINLVDMSGGNLTIRGNAVTTTTPNNWHTFFSRDRLSGPARFSFRIGDASTVVVMTLKTADPAGDADPNGYSNGYGIYVQGQIGAIYTYDPVNGFVAKSTGLTFAVGDLFEVVNDNVNMRFFRNGTEVPSSAMTVPLDQLWRLAAQLYYGSVTDIRLTPAPNRGLERPGSGYRVGDPRNLPPITSMNLGYKFTGAISYTAAAGTPATATISVGAGSALIGSQSIAYNAMSVGVTGTGGTTVDHHLYVVENTNPGSWGGSKTLVATTNGNTIFSGDNNVYIGTASVTFPTSGTGGGGGSGGGGYCVQADAWVETRNRGFVPARDIVEGDELRVLAGDRAGTEWGPCEANHVALAEGWRLVSISGIEVTLSETTPITLRDGSIINVADVDGHELPVLDAAGFRWEACRVEQIGPIEVAHIRCFQRTYAAGDVAGLAILTHNPKP